MADAEKDVPTEVLGGAAYSLLLAAEVCTQGHTDRRQCCLCCGWGTVTGYACCGIPPTTDQGASGD